MTEDAVRALSFGAAADQYERARPSYPAELIDDLAALQPGDVLEVGCGTGKASAMLLGRVPRLLAVEPDPRMAAVARRKGVEVEVSPFERWDPRGRRFDLIVAGQSWHWVPEPEGATLARAILRPGGHLAAFWNIGSHDDATAAILDPIYREIAPEIAEDTTALHQPGAERHAHVEALVEAGLGPIEVRTYDWQAEYSRARWLDYIGTHSDHLTLPDAQRDELLERVGCAIDSLGGVLVYHFQTVLVLAARG